MPIMEYRLQREEFLPDDSVETKFILLSVEYRVFGIAFKSDPQIALDTEITRITDIGGADFDVTHEEHDEIDKFIYMNHEA